MGRRLILKRPLSMVQKALGILETIGMVAKSCILNPV